MNTYVKAGIASAALLILAAPAGAFVHASAGTAVTDAAQDGVGITAASGTPAPAIASDVVTASDDVVAAIATAPRVGNRSSAGGASGDADAAGSSEVDVVQRRCGDDADPHYEPSSGFGQSECLDANGNFDPDRTYTARHFTNEVRCGEEHLIVPNSDVVNVSGDGGGGAEGGGGFLQVCSDKDAPLHGRATAEGDITTDGDVDGSISVDGDGSNPGQATGWAQVNIDDDGVSHRCGKAYADGGRGDASNPTDEDTAEQCG